MIGTLVTNPDGKLGIKNDKAFAGKNPKILAPSHRIAVFAEEEWCMVPSPISRLLISERKPAKVSSSLGEEGSSLASQVVRLGGALDAATFAASITLTTARKVG